MVVLIIIFIVAFMPALIVYAVIKSGLVEKWQNKKANKLNKNKPR